MGPSSKSMESNFSSRLPRSIPAHSSPSSPNSENFSGRSTTEKRCRTVFASPSEKESASIISSFDRCNHPPDPEPRLFSFIKRGSFFWPNYIFSNVCIPKRSSPLLSTISTFLSKYSLACFSFFSAFNTGSW